MSKKDLQERYARIIGFSSSLFRAWAVIQAVFVVVSTQNSVTLHDNCADDGELLQTAHLQHGSALGENMLQGLSLGESTAFPQPCPEVPRFQ